LKQELQEACEIARNRGQNAYVEQLAAEAKASILEGQIKQREHMAQSRKERCSRARKTSRRDMAMADSQLLKLGRRVERLQRTLKGERTSRKSAETRHRRAQSITIQTSRYLESILNVNQELVTATAAKHSPLIPTMRQTASAHGMGSINEFQRKPNNGYFVPRVVPQVDRNGVDVGAAVADVLLVGRAGGDAVPCLSALYERIGFCAMQGGGGNDGGIPSLPTSPSQVRVNHTLDQNALQDIENKNTRKLHSNLTRGTGGFFLEEDGAGVRESPRRRLRDRGPITLKGDAIPGHDRNKYGTGNEVIGMEATRGYSFAHSPKARVASVAENSPDVLNRLEALALRLEEERGNAEKWYKDVVKRASPGEQALGTGAHLDAGSLVNAIASLQEKAQQLEVVRESVSAMKASPRTPAITSPIVCRRKVAALHVLHELCHDVVAGEIDGSHAA
ncbi:unnamed protein product, partial [Scytosiphon promiscuus]